MECQECHMRPAALHLTKIVNGEKTTVHLCEQCAKEKGDNQSGLTHVTMHDVLSGLLGFEESMPELSKSAVQKQSQPMSHYCSYCGMTYQEFAQAGKFGCEQCYEAFSDSLDAVFKRVHGGHTVHKGKVPKRTGHNLRTQQEIEDLRQQLKHHVDKEEFEQAAEIRDYIHSLEERGTD